MAWVTLCLSSSDFTLPQCSQISPRQRIVMAEHIFLEFQELKPSQRAEWLRRSKAHLSKPHLPQEHGPHWAPDPPSGFCTLIQAFTPWGPEGGRCSAFHTWLAFGKISGTPVLIPRRVLLWQMSRYEYRMIVPHSGMSTGPIGQS